MDIADVLRKETKTPFERFRIVRQFEDLHLSAIQRGIVFIFAIWSGPAYIAFHRFTRLLANIDTSKLELVILDIDCLSPESGAALWGRSVGGAGETVWIRNGVVVARLLLYAPDSDAELLLHTRELLDE